MNEQPDFTCRVCGCECPTAPPLPERAVCEAHCEFHEYEYDRWRRGKFCIHCDHEEPYEPIEGDIPLSPIPRDRPLGTPMNQISGRPGHPGYEEFKRIAASWGYP